MVDKQAAKLSQSPEKTNLAQPPAATLSDDTELSTEAKLNLDIGEKIKILRWHQNHFHDLNTESERKKNWYEANKVNEDINYCKRLLRQLQQGKKVNIDQKYFEKKGETDFDVPDTPLDHDNKLRKMRSIRSKRKKKMAIALQDHGENSPQYMEALKEWKHFEDVVNHLKNTLDERTKRG